jgi:hypothetical protein
LPRLSRKAVKPRADNRESTVFLVMIQLLRMCGDAENASDRQ